MNTAAEIDDRFAEIAARVLASKPWANKATADAARELVADILVRMRPAIERGDLTLWELEQVWSYSDFVSFAHETAERWS